jgi:hypothetical protein
MASVRAAESRSDVNQGAKRGVKRRSQAPRVPQRPALDPERVITAFARLARLGALPTLVRGALPVATLRRLLKDAMPRRMAAEMPPEVWSNLAVSIALESGVFGLPLGQALHDRLGWDKSPGSLDEWWRVVREEPLEALWMAALSEDKTVRKEFAHIVEHCVQNYRSSPACTPPSWEFVDGVLAVQSETLRRMREAEKHAEDSEGKSEADKERVEELREELRRLRRENAELRGDRAQAERRAASMASQVEAVPDSEQARRLEDLERRLRKAEKEREHLARELERARSERPRAEPAPTPLEPEPGEDASLGGLEATEGTPLSTDSNPRRRVLRQMLRKLLKKGKIGASHTHEDNVYKGVADHEKGIAKQAIELLYREGLFVPKPTTTDPHVSINPDRVTEVRVIIAGDVTNPRMRRWIEP